MRESLVELHDLADLLFVTDKLISAEMGYADAVELLEVLAKIREVRKRIHGIEGMVEIAAAKAMGQRSLEWDGGRAERHKTAKRVTWHSDDLAHTVAARTMADDNGELPGEQVQAAVSRVVSAIANCAAFSYWRVGQLEPLGITADEYRSSEPGRWVVDVQLGSEAAA